jgi:MoxR-like ATPase
VVVERMTTAVEGTTRVLDPERLIGYQRRADAVYVDPAVIEYAVRLATATRDPAAAGQDQIARYLSFGASPRASINMILAGKALAFLRGRDYLLPGDVADLARDVLRHRIVLSYEALADGVSPDALLTPILHSVPPPDIPLREKTPWSAPTP